MNTYHIPVVWTMRGFVDVQAENINEAVEKAQTDPSIGLPEGEYLEDSWEVDGDATDILLTHNEQLVDFAIHKDFESWEAAIGKELHLTQGKLFSSQLDGWIVFVKEPEFKILNLFPSLESCLDDFHISKASDNVLLMSNNAGDYEMVGKYPT